MYSRTQVRSASASCGVNSGVTAMDRNEYTAPPSGERTGPHPPEAPPSGAADHPNCSVVLVCVDFDDHCLGADRRDVTAIERLRRDELRVQAVAGSQQVPAQP